MPASSPLPESCAVAFKEWAGVCQALRDGRQTIILRKGGVSEGPDGFRPEHDAFWLYPTSVHQQEQGLRDGYGRPAELAESEVALDLIAHVVSVDFVDRLDTLDRLESEHVWTAETVRKRFQYRTPGLWVLGVRIYRREMPWRIPVTAEHVGCKSWVPLDAPLATEPSVPVLEREEFVKRLGLLSPVTE